MNHEKQKIKEIEFLEGSIIKLLHLIQNLNKNSFNEKSRKGKNIFVSRLTSFIFIFLFVDLKNSTIWNKLIQ